MFIPAQVLRSCLRGGLVTAVFTVACQLDQVADGDGKLVAIITEPQETVIVPSASQQFEAYGVTAAGDTISAAVYWSASGGEISATGMFTPSDGAGEYLIAATDQIQVWLTDTSRVIVEMPPLVSLAISPREVTVEAKDSTVFEAYGLTADGAVTEVQVVWTTTGGGTIQGRGNGNAHGHFKACRPGKYKVTATAVTGQLKDSADVTVTDVNVAISSVAVSPDAVDLLASQSVQLATELFDAEGNPTTCASVEWSSDNPAVAVVTTEGLVTGLTAGQATVTATSGTASGTATITVTHNPVATVTVSPANTALSTGEDVLLVASLRDSDGNTLTGRSVVWSSSNVAVATVTQTGLVSAQGAGSTTITASSEGKSGSATIDVAGASAVPAPTLQTAVIQSPESTCARINAIVCEDFETDARSNWSDYQDNDFRMASDDAFGGTRAMRQRYGLGQESAGWLAWFFGDHPLGGAHSGEQFQEIYFRWYHKFQEGWPAQYPPKTARIRSHYVDCGWCFAWREHFWLREDGTAVSDPASNIAAPAGTVWIDTRRWLGERAMAFSVPPHDGEWTVMEMRVRLNSPGNNDGQITFWANGEQVLDRTGVNLRGAYTGTTINVAMIDTYWNGGSPQAGLTRWYDNVVVATEHIGCAPFTIRKDALAGQTSWQVQVAENTDGQTVVWDSGEIVGTGTGVDVSDATGTFSAGASTCVLPAAGYVVRGRQATAAGWSHWSEWSSMF